METAKAKCHHPDDRAAGRRAAVIMNGLGDSVAARVWAAVAKLLESGQISMIGICAICARFHQKPRLAEMLPTSGMQAKLRQHTIGRQKA